MLRVQYLVYVCMCFPPGGVQRALVATRSELKHRRLAHRTSFGHPKQINHQKSTIVSVCLKWLIWVPPPLFADKTRNAEIISYIHTLPAYETDDCLDKNRFKTKLSTTQRVRPSSAREHTMSAVCRRKKQRCRQKHPPASCHY